MSNKIVVIGGGISGITTALTLQSLGHETEIYADKIATDTIDKRSNPEFASLFPSASVIPHSVYSDQLADLFQLSQSIFYELRKLTFPGVTIHKHYEVFEFKPTQPAYCDWMLNLQSIEDSDPDEIPRRSNRQKLHGWVFDCIFADWPLYLPALYEMYKNSGGTVTHQKLQRKDISDLHGEIIINCSGTSGPTLFDDPSDEQLLVRGHLLHKSDTPLITNSENEIISYNYTPQASVYSDAEGNPCDVYCYPRKDGWVLGGSRQPGQLHNTKWENHEDSATYTIEDISFPHQVIDLNKEILETTFNTSLEKSAGLTPSIGYRYIRNRENGLRIDQETIGGKVVYHNYGHGGAGVTLSWGCAIKIAKDITTKKPSEIKTSLLKKFSASELLSS